MIEIRFAEHTKQKVVFAVGFIKMEEKDGFASEDISDKPKCDVMIRKVSSLN